MKTKSKTPQSEAPTVPAPATSTQPARRLHLEYVEAGTLTENPGNWRRHPQEQLNALRELIDDPDVGWAGTLLFNERTGRLIDGHARKAVTDPKALVPVVFGDWSEEAERKILLTHDPMALQAEGDAAQYAALLETVNANGLWVRDLMQSTLRDLDAQAAAAADPDASAEDGAPSPMLAQMECQPFEHHDFLMLIFRNDQDLQMACEKLGIKRVAIQYPGGKQKIGLGRVIDGAKAIRLLEDRGVKGP